MALVDEWRPETHTFHMPCGEMAPTLQDVSMILGLPLTGDPVGPWVITDDWIDDLQERFALVDRDPVHGPLEAHPRIVGPSKKWLLQFRVRNSIISQCIIIFKCYYLIAWLYVLQVEYLPEDVDDNSVSFLGGLLVVDVRIRND